MNGETQEKAIGESPIAPYSVVPSITTFGGKRVSKVYTNDMKVYVILNLNRRIPNGTYGGVRGRGLITPSYSIIKLSGVLFQAGLRPFFVEFLISRDYKSYFSIQFEGITLLISRTNNEVQAELNNSKRYLLTGGEKEMKALQAYAAEFNKDL
jgi:hypothetical protein